MNKESPKLTRRQLLQGFGATVGGTLLSSLFPREVEADEKGEYIVKPGDTLYKIAQENGLTLNEITEANPQIGDINLIEIGDKVSVSGSQTEPVTKVKSDKEKLITPEEQEIKYPVYWGNRSRPEVALTFDDGFSEASIKRVLSATRESNLQLTFFIIGQQLEAHPDLWRQAVQDGHQVCNHTYTHTYLTELDNEGIRREMRGWEQAEREVLGEKYLQKMKNNFPYIRFPGGAGHKSKRVLRTVGEMGYVPIAWSQDTYSSVLKKHNYSEEPAKPIADEVEQYTVKTAQNGSIILLHLNIWDTLDLYEMITGINEKGLRIKAITGILA